MALKIFLKDRTGADLMSYDLPDGTTLYPEVVTKGDDLYILRRVAPDKRTAIYFEARTHKIRGS